MPKVFICYRREDSAYPAQQIYGDLTKHFGSESVVFDIDTIPLGTDFREYLNKEVSKCDILLAVIGDQWIEILKQRLDEPTDFVRIEIQAALEREIPVVPVLVGNASVPSEKNLPPELAGLAYKNAAEVRAGPDLQNHLKRLIGGLDRLLAERKAEDEQKQKEAKARFRAEEERKRKEAETKIKPDKPEPAKVKPPESKPDAKATIEPESPKPRKFGNIVKFGVVTGVIVLLMVGIWLYISKPTSPPKAGTAKEQAAQVQKQVETRPGHMFRDKLKDGSEGPEMIILAEGNFLMGSPFTERGRSNNEGPQRRVTISRPFALSTIEITFAEYDKFAKAAGRQLPDDKGWGRGDRPVIKVSWEDATAYAQWLSEQTGQNYRLPSEAEWEYAVRAGSTTAYSFGDNPSRLGEYAWFDSNSGEKTHPVGEKQPNAWGLYDMHGNVWEWVEDDWHNNYDGAPGDGRARIKVPRGAYRVMRGGSWSRDAPSCRSANRYGNGPDYRYYYVGFRLSRSVALGP